MASFKSCHRGSRKHVLVCKGCFRRSLRRNPADVAFEPRLDTQQLNHVCASLGGKMPTVLPVVVRFSFGGHYLGFCRGGTHPASAQQLCADFANSNRSSASLRSSAGGTPSPQSRPRDLTDCLRALSTAGRTAKNSRGLKTQPWRTPPQILNQPCFGATMGCKLATVQVGASTAFFSRSFLLELLLSLRVREPLNHL